MSRQTIARFRLFDAYRTPSNRSTDSISVGHTIYLIFPNTMTGAARLIFLLLRELEVGWEAGRMEGGGGGDKLNLGFRGDTSIFF